MSGQANYRLLKSTMQPLVTRWLAPLETVEGLHNLPESGPALLVANHRTVTDPLVLGAAVPRPISWVMAPFLSSVPLVGALTRQIGQIPLQHGPHRHVRLLAMVMDAWSEGRIVGIFPEGMAGLMDPHPENSLVEFNPGFARIFLAARDAELPIVPAALRSHGLRPFARIPYLGLELTDPEEPRFQQPGSFEVLTYGSVSVHFGAPVRLHDCVSDDTSAEDAERCLCRELRQRVDAMLR